MYSVSEEDRIATVEYIEILINNKYFAYFNYEYSLHLLSDWMLQTGGISPLYLPAYPNYCEGWFSVLFAPIRLQYRILSCNMCADEDSSLLEHDYVWLGIEVPKFRRRLPSTSSGYSWNKSTQGHIPGGWKQSCCGSVSGTASDQHRQTPARLSEPATVAVVPTGSRRRAATHHRVH